MMMDSSVRRLQRIPKGVDKTEFYQHDQNWMPTR
jgi:hypothetical protein